MRISSGRFESGLLIMLSGLAVVGCASYEPIRPSPNPSVPLEQSVDWHNWSRNLLHEKPTSGVPNYFSPTSRDELAYYVTAARDMRIQVRVTGQRHSQAPLVTDDNRGAAPYHPETYLIDLSCYSDLNLHFEDAVPGQTIYLDAANKRVTVNAGVREDHLEAFLASNNFMLKTVTAGGFFSVGGMTAVDVHGATVQAPIVAETAVAFNIMGPDGVVTTIDETTDGGNGWDAIQFARVSLGALGIVTSVTLEIEERPWATTLKSGRERFKVSGEDEFVERFTDLLSKYDRIESFFEPYSRRFLVLWWDTDSSPEKWIANAEVSTVATACDYAEQSAPGAPNEASFIENLAYWFERNAQAQDNPWVASLMIRASFTRIKYLAWKARRRHQGHWLTSSPRAAFMSYYIDIPDLGDAGLRRTWGALNRLTDDKQVYDPFQMAAPLEFRFVKGGDSALSGTYSEKPNPLFVNLDMILFTKETHHSGFDPELLKFAADVERVWYGYYEGAPHNGKLFGFHNPRTNAPHTPPFDSGYLQDLAAKRSDRIDAFEAYRRSRDPQGVFCNDYLRSAQLCRDAPSAVPTEASR